MQLSDLNQPSDYLKVPELDKNEIRMLWHVGFWDVPTSGVLEYRGRRYWFQTTEDLQQSESADLKYLVVQLSERQLAEEEHWHNLFRQKVGTHTDYDEQGHREIGALRPGSSHHEFYNAYKQRARPDLSSNEVIGWYAP